MTAALQAIKIWRGMREPANQLELSCRAPMFFKRTCHSERSEETPTNLGELCFVKQSCHSERSEEPPNDLEEHHF